MAKKDFSSIRGFQLMAAYHHKGTFNNVSYHDLSRATAFTEEGKTEWDFLTDEDWRQRKFEKSAKGMHDLLMQFRYFRRLSEWGYSIAALTSDGATMGFYVGLVKHWEGIGKPTTSTHSSGALFGKNAYILLDRLFVEVMKGQWGGSGDNAAKVLIGEMEDHGDHLLNPISDDEWKTVWTKMACGSGDFEDGDELTEGQLMNDKVVSKKKMSASKKQSIPAWVQKMMIHYYCTCDIESFTKETQYKDSKIHWDHIIPDSKFTAGADNAVFCNNIGNACALPDHENIKKSSKELTHTDCNSGSTKDMIEKYSELTLATDGINFDNAAKSKDLVLYRGKLLMDNFIRERKKIYS